MPLLLLSHHRGFMSKLHVAHMLLYPTTASSEFILNVVVDKNVMAEISAQSSASSLWLLVCAP